jgi:hypothetical protein
MNRFDLAVALAMTVFCSCSPASHANPAAPMTNEQAATAILDYYPASARASGIEGLALLHCHENEHLRLTDCTLSGESPTGFGFGEAALTLANLSQDNIGVTETPSPAGGFVQFAFKLSPPSIMPNTLLPLTSPLDPSFIHFRQKPSINLLYRPKRAVYAHLGGRAVLDCVITKEGKLKPCVVASENPPGLDLGISAANFAATWSLVPPMVDGQPQGGSHILIAIEFGRQ